MVTEKLQGGANMPKLDDTAILKRAKELLRNGAKWDWTERSNKPSLDQEDRRKYLALAWKQLLETSGQSSTNVLTSATASVGPTAPIQRPPLAGTSNSPLARAMAR
jgi:hypothetical protein